MIQRSTKYQTTYLGMGYFCYSLHIKGSPQMKNKNNVFIWEKVLNVGEWCGGPKLLVEFVDQCWQKSAAFQMEVIGDL